MCPSKIDSRVTLQVLVRFGAKQRLWGLPVEMSRSSIAVVLPGDDGLALPEVSARVTLAFSGASLRSPLRFGARTLHRRHYLGIARCRFQIATLAERALQKIPFRREAYRAIIPTDVPSFVEAEPVEGGALTWAELTDVSMGGLSFLVPDFEDRDFARGQELYLSFELPGREGTLHLVGAVQHRRPLRTGAQYGIRFDYESLEHPEALRETLGMYIAGRQLALLRRLNGGPDA